MGFPCLGAARRFEPGRHLPFVIDNRQVGWVRRDDLHWLAGFEHVIGVDADRVELSPSLDTVAARSDALHDVIGALAANGRITGWRDETYGVRNRFDDPPLAFIERAASRFFGTQTFAAHLNGIVQAPDADEPKMWIARRSLSKAADPGMLDNLVGGGIGWGYSVEETLYKECWEESGIPEPLARQAVHGGTLYVLQEIEEGTQAEQLFIFDLDVGVDFEPRNQDGEVADHRLAAIDEVLGWIGEGLMTVDASLAALDWMSREGARRTHGATAGQSRVGEPPAGAWLDVATREALQALTQPTS
jgi:8-oxo-dGTP pyrophosphatase MutT (NUDIX family)